MTMTIRPVVVIDTFGCAISDILSTALQQHSKFALVDGKDGLLNSLECLPDLVDFKVTCEHVIKYVDPPTFHTINVVYDFVNVDAIRSAIKPSRSASFVFVGSIPEVYRDVLSGQIVRVAMEFGDVAELVNGLLESLMTSFCVTFVKENMWMNEPNSTLHPIGQINKYADKVWQSGRDFMKIVQTATGPLPPLYTPFVFRRSSQPSAEEEGVKRQGQSGLCYLLLTHRVDEHCKALLKRLEASRVDKGHYSEFALICRLWMNDNVDEIAIPDDLSKALRIVAIAAKHDVAAKLDWKRLLQFHVRLAMACGLAVASCKGLGIADRHFVALKNIVLKTNSLNWAKCVLPFDLPDSISILPNELVTLRIGSFKVEQVSCNDSAVNILESCRVGGELIVSMETHVYSSRRVVFLLHTGHEPTTAWGCFFDVSMDGSDDSLVKRFRVAENRHLIYLMTFGDVEAIEYMLHQDHKTSLYPDKGEREWLIHTHTNHLCALKLNLGGEGKKVLFWSNQFLPKEIIK